MKVKSLGRVQLPATPLTAAYQAPLSVGFARQEDWSGVLVITIIASTTTMAAAIVMSLKKFFLIGRKLLYNVVLVSAYNNVNQP